MKRIFGKVLVKETNEGVANLVVAAFDHHEGVAQRYEEGLAVDRLGHRLGSVLTERDGSFVLEAAECEPAGGGARPDLVLAVFAPEDAQSVQLPVPLPANQRLLHISAAPRSHAGSVEAYVVRLLRSQLEACGIFPSDRPLGFHSSGAAIEQYARSVERRLEVRTHLASRLSPLLERQLRRTEAIQTEAKAKLASLCAVPRSRRTDALFVSPGTPIAEPHLAAIRSGMRSVQASTAAFRVALGTEQLAALGVEPGSAEFAVGVDAGQLQQQLMSVSGGTDLVRRRTLLDACVTKSGAQPPPPVLNGDATPAEPGPPGAPPTRQEIDGQIASRIEGQLAALPGGDSVGRRPNQDDVNRSLEALDLKGGPADVASFHDFQVLQVAFRHVWTQAFDGQLRAQAEALYEEVVRVYDEAGLQMPPVGAIDDVNQLKAFLDGVRRTLGGPPAQPPNGPASIPLGGIPFGLLSGGVKIAPPPASYAAPPAPSDFQQAFPELVWAWPYMSPEQRLIVQDLCVAANTGSDAERDHARAIVRSIAQHPDGAGGRLQKLMLELGAALGEPYAFDVFAPDSYNFGIMLTYRQKWEPESYQAGELVATIPLAPGETRKYSKRRVVKRTRAEKEVERALNSGSTQTSEASRAEAEILKKATTATNFKLSADGSFNIGVGSISASSAFGGNQSEDSATTKKEFHEATLKAAEEYRRERSLEVDTLVSDEAEETQSGEISNPNNEITVTYLLYELERRYRISEHLHRARPVILVAQDVPAPHEITEAWLVQHQWILARVLLDSSLRPALDYLVTGLAGDEVSIEVLRARWEAQRAVIAKVEAQVQTQIELRDALREELVQTSRQKAESQAMAMPTIAKVLTLGLAVDPGETNAAFLEAARQAAETRLSYVEETLADGQRKLTNASSAFESATREYAAVLQNQYSRHIAIDQLRVHVKQNILYYMQAIWDHEPPDQRFFRLYDKKVICPKPGLGLVPAPGAPPAAPAATLTKVKAQTVPLSPAAKTLVSVQWHWGPAIEQDEVELVEIADLDHPLGYKGNYMIFPLKRPCFLTTFMLREFIDDYFGVRDPDELGNYSIEELESYVRCVLQQEDVPAEEKRALRSYYDERLTRDRPRSDTIIVPTGQLFIEALPGRHPLLEDFKLRHRFEDLRKAQADVRHAELENIRLAARLNSGEKSLLEDPDIEKRIVVDGGARVVVE